MPHSTITIVASQRDALYEQVRDHLAALDDLGTALECSKDYAAAERLARQFAEDFRLMADLGWNPDDDRDAVELTMPPGDLMGVAKRLRKEAQGGLAGLMEERDSVAPLAVIDGYELTRDTCEAIILEVLSDAQGARQSLVASKPTSAAIRVVSSQNLARCSASRASRAASTSSAAVAGSRSR
jgi:hypothetical protein